MNYINCLLLFLLSLSALAQRNNSEWAQSYLEIRENNNSLTEADSSFKQIISSLDAVNELPADYPHLPFLKQSIKTFSSGRKYLQYIIDDLYILQNNSELKAFLDNTVEVIFYPNSQYGHIRLRVGRRLYGFEFFRSSLLADYDVRLGSDKEGFIFHVPKKKIDQLQNSIEKFYNGSNKFNMPGFDAGGSNMKLVVEGLTKRYQSKRTDSFGNHLPFEADIIKIDNKHYLKNDDGVKLPLTLNAGEFWVEGFSCASSVTYVLKKYLGIDIKKIKYARSLRKYLAGGNSKGKTPIIARIDYKAD